MNFIKCAPATIDTTCVSLLIDRFARISPELSEKFQYAIRETVFAAKAVNDFIECLPCERMRAQIRDAFVEDLFQNSLFVKS